LAVLLLHLLATVARLAGPGGARSVVAESVLVKHQLLILNRPRKRSPKLRLPDRMIAGLCALLIRPSRLIRSAIVLKPSTLLRLHRALTTRKYRRLFSTNVPTKPGPKGPSQEMVAAVVDMKRRNPTWGCRCIAQQIVIAFGIPLNKTWCGAFSPGGTGRGQTQMGRPGSRSSVMRKTVCGVSICFDANPPSSAHTGVGKLPADRFAAALLVALSLREQFSQDRLSSFAKGLRVNVVALCKWLKADKPDEPAS